MPTVDRKPSTAQAAAGDGERRGMCLACKEEGQQVAGEPLYENRDENAE